MATTNVLKSLSGAVGIMMRKFWPDLALSITDQYAGYSGHLQYPLHLSASTKLVMNTVSCQEGLNIVIGKTQQQQGMITELQAFLNGTAAAADTEPSLIVSLRRLLSSSINLNRQHATYRQISTSPLTDPIAKLLDNLRQELTDLIELRDNTDKQVTRIVQLVNIRLEDHRKAIIIFAIVHYRSPAFDLRLELLRHELSRHT